MTLSKILWDLHHSSDVGNAVEGLAELAEALERDLPIHKANTDKLAELVLYCVQRKIGRANQEAHEAMMIHCDALTDQIALVKAAYGNLAGAINNLDETDTDKEEMWGQVFSVMQDGWNSFSRDMANYYQGQLNAINEYCIKNGFEFVQHNPALTMIHEMEKLRSERDAAMREASELAVSIWKAEFQQLSPNFELCDSPAGVISQIDNMYAGIRNQRDALAGQLVDAFGDGYYDGFLDGAKHHEKTDCNTDPNYLGEDALRCSEIAEQAKSKRMGTPSRLDILVERDALKVMVEALLAAINEVASSGKKSGFGVESPESVRKKRLAWMRLNELRQSTPQQYLAEIKAQAIKDFVKSLPSYAHNYDVNERLEKQASQYAAKIINGEIK